MNNETVEILRKINRCSTIEEVRDIIFDVFSKHTEEDDYDKMLGPIEFVTYRDGEPITFVMSGSNWKKIDNLIKNYENINAIKLFRKITGWNLAESEFAVENNFAPPD